MPARLDAESQYQKDFKWQPDFLKFAPKYLNEEDMNYAGVSSAKLANTFEPPIQRKKRTVFEKADDDEYMLLGDQAKFGQSIVYRTRRSVSCSRERSLPKEPIEEKKEKKDEEIQVKPAPVVIVDTGAKKSETKPTKDKEIFADRLVEKLHEVDENRKKEKSKEKTVSHVRESRNDKRNKENIKILKKAKENKRVRPIKKDKLVKEVVASVEEKRPVEIEKPAEKDYILKYKAGIAPTRPKFKRLSEYQRQFNWKTALHASPILQAEQVVFNSDASLHPPKLKERVESEYCKQYNESAEVAKEETKLRRSKSESMIAAPGSKPSITVDNKRLIKESANPLTPFFPTKSATFYRSEYDQQYKPPQVYDYEDGCWKRSAPKTSEISSSWYQEVIELRKLATAYKNRGYGIGAKTRSPPYEEYDISSISDVEATTIENSSNIKSSDNNDARKEAWTWKKFTPNSEESNSSQPPTPAPSAEESDEEGRVPTPVLKSSVVERRHHLDRTTPAVGGALLVAKSKGSEKVACEDKAIYVDMPEPNEERVVPKSWEDKWSQVPRKIDKHTSLSTRSLASSYSIASACLERAKQRENFWKN
ncbi:DgyrCDS10245 [Dimorphilus gyrociliatus]|uniref:Nuclear protein MDM1 n=1 Tax=Dimorphilus gyrociliatus TaxID=2664684 RepID=A0A7I8VZK3_9ANNE|nr:DgyrCDS10245 [Dimorphilus gyrociliatus]